jgi:hypothetical protein
MLSNLPNKPFNFAASPPAVWRIIYSMRSAFSISALKSV